MDAEEAADSFGSQGGWCMNPNAERWLLWYPEYPKWKKAVFDHYGRKCQCCGSYEVPTIDHIDGGGKEHRAEIGGLLYKWLVENDFPEGYQTLCRRCNSSKADTPGCRIDHKGEKK